MILLSLLYQGGNLYQRGNLDRQSVGDVVLAGCYPGRCGQAGGDAGLTIPQPVLCGDALGRRTTVLSPTPWWCGLLTILRQSI